MYSGEKHLKKAKQMPEMENLKHHVSSVCIIGCSVNGAG